MRNRGFTLIEVMLSVSITALLIVLLVNVANAVSSAWQRGEAQAESQSNARGAINLMARELQGAVIDLDLGFRILTVDGESNNFKLKFLSHTEPATTEASAAKMVCYQLAWADRRIIPHIQPAYSPAHPMAVLVRTECSDLQRIFNVSKPEDAEEWTLKWGDIPPDGIRAGEEEDSNRTEIAADNVLGWQVIPYSWQTNTTEADKPGAGSRFYDKFLTSDKAPRAVEIKIASMPTRLANRAAEFTEWSGIRGEPLLFNVQRLNESPFNTLLRQGASYFTTTVYLQSKTP